ncbi:putative immunity protein [Rhodococcus sp. NPDC058521]|uniref:putative immunity protein n=1 Tax=Rhodococcus sp. NPDC058521 TaxID=3346536 RepID=UPI0036473013
MSPSAAENPRTPDFVLTSDELRAVSAFNVACVEQVIELFDEANPDDRRPRAALNAAEAFVRGGPRTKEQRDTALAAHRAAKQVHPPASHVAMAAGDAAASAYLHPLADAEQVGHILRGPAYCVLALQLRPVEPLNPSDAMVSVIQHANSRVVEVLLRYPRVSHRRREVAQVIAELDARLRSDSISGPK